MRTSEELRKNSFLIFGFRLASNSEHQYYPIILIFEIGQAEQTIDKQFASHKKHQKNAQSLDY